MSTYIKDLSNIVNAELIDADDLGGELTKIETAIEGLNDLFTSEGTITGARVHQNSLQVENAFNYFVSGAGATTDIIKITTTGTPSSYEKGMRFVTNVNTLPASADTPMKFQIDSLTATNIKTSAGVNLTAGDMTLGQLLEVVYDGTSFIASNFFILTPEAGRMLEVSYTSTTSVTFTFKNTVDFTRKVAEDTFVTLPYEASGYVVSTSNLVDGSTAGEGDTLIPYVANSTIYFSNTSNLVSVTVGGTSYDAFQLPYAFVLYNDSGIKFIPFLVLSHGEYCSTIVYTHDPKSSNITRIFAGQDEADDGIFDFSSALPSNASSFRFFINNVSSSGGGFEITITGASGRVYYGSRSADFTDFTTAEPIDCLGDQSLQVDFIDTATNSVDGHIVAYEVQI